MTDPSQGDVTRILDRARQGERSAAEQLLPLVYNELRALSHGFFQRQQSDHTLQPTALVHEAFVKLVGPSEIEWESRAHFFAVAAKAMRQVLTDHARRKRAAKRGGDDQQRVSLSGIHTPAGGSDIDLIALEDALAKLETVDERQARVVEMRFLVGMTVPETAAAMDISTATVEREWRMARAWLRRELSGESDR